MKFTLPMDIEPMFDFLSHIKNKRPMRIVVNGHPALRRVSDPVAGIDDEARALAEELLRSLLESEVPGVGLAAPQIGVNKRMIALMTAVDDDRRNPRIGLSPGEMILEPRMPMVLVNPEIVACGEEMSTSEEGCLSLPGVSGEVTRPKTVTLHATTIDGEEFTIECGGLLARCLQHEIDHLDGILFYDRLSEAEKKAGAAQMRLLARREAAKSNSQAK